MNNDGGYLMTEEESRAFQWCIDNDIVMIQWEWGYNLKTGKVTQGKVHYYNSKGDEVTHETQHDLQ